MLEADAEAVEFEGEVVAAVAVAGELAVDEAAEATVMAAETAAWVPVSGMVLRLHDEATLVRLPP